MNILFICTHNRCRSAICEAITNNLSDGRLRAFSAGSQPAGEIHPLTLKYLEKRGIPIEGLKSESWDIYFDKNIDVAITVCDSAAAESCPLWLGETHKVHWGLADPSKIEGSEAQVEEAFMALISKVESRIERILQLDLEDPSTANFKETLQQIGQDN